MSLFFGKVTGSSDKPVSRQGDMRSGLLVEAASWDGCIEVRLWYDKSNGLNMFEVLQKKWDGEGMYESIASGVIGKPSLERFGVLKEAAEWEAECQRKS